MAFGRVESPPDGKLKYGGKKNWNFNPTELQGQTSI
jgi:hypothetical protein